MSTTSRRRSVLATAVAAVLATHVAAQQPRPDTPPEAVTLFRNVRVFNGKSASLSAPTTVLVRGNRIASIGGTLRSDTARR